MGERRGLLEARVAVVTGAGAGIGRAIAMAFAAEGARVVAADIQAEPGEHAAAAIRAAGGEAIAVAADVRERADLERVAECASRTFGGVDVLVNNVGGTFRRPFLEIEEKGWDAILRLNLKSVLHGTRVFAPRIAERGGGSILNVVTIEAVRAAPLYAPYAAAKAAVVEFTRTMALELAGARIRVNALAPDICLTEGLRAMLDDEALARHEFMVPLGHAAEPDEIAGPAVFLASDLARYVTGVLLHVDGGTHAAGGWYRDPAAAPAADATLPPAYVLGPPPPVKPGPR